MIVRGDDAEYSIPTDLQKRIQRLSLETLSLSLHKTNERQNSEQGGKKEKNRPIIS